MKRFVRKWDCGNPRYAAERPPSQMGLLCGQRTRPSGFVEPTPSETAAFYRTQAAEVGNYTIDVAEGDQTRDDSPAPEEEDVFEDAEPYVRPQYAPFEETQ